MKNIHRPKQTLNNNINKEIIEYELNKKSSEIETSLIAKVLAKHIMPIENNGEEIYQVDINTKGNDEGS